MVAKHFTVATLLSALVTLVGVTDCRAEIGGTVSLTLSVNFQPGGYFEAGDYLMAQASGEGHSDAEDPETEIYLTVRIVEAEREGTGNTTVAPGTTQEIGESTNYPSVPQLHPAFYTVEAELFYFQGIGIQTLATAYDSFFTD